MIRVKTCFVAEGITNDRDTGQTSAFGLLENLQGTSYPLLVPRIAFFCLFERASADPERSTAELSVMLKGQDVVRQAIDLDFEGNLRARCTIRFNGFTLREPGDVVFRLAIPGHETAEWAIHADPVARAAASSRPFGPPGSGRIYESDPVSISVISTKYHRP